MGAQVTVVTGPARSGKTLRLLARYREALARRGAPNRVLWIAPTGRSAAHVRDRLLCEKLPACFSPGVATFDRFAESVLQASEVEIRPIGEQTKRQLLRRLLDAARDGDQLRHFKAIAASDGLVELAAAFISELKRLEIWPDHFGRACRERGATDKDRELIRLYADYQEALNNYNLYDKEGRYWTARRLLREGQKRPYEHLELVVVDGFTDFTRTQHEILQILAERVQELFVTLPLEDAPVREDLFARSLETLGILKQNHAGLKVETLPRWNPPDWPAITHIERDLFKSPHDLTPIDAVENIEILACPRQLGETQTIARRIKQLIVEEGAPPGDIAVVYRSLADAAPLVREVFAEFGLPVAIEAAQTLDAAPMVKALAALLRLQLDDWPFRQVLGLVSNNYFRPHLPEWNEVQSRMAAERIVRHLQIPGGRAALVEQVGHWARLDESEDAAEWSDAARAKMEDARRAWPVIEALARALDALPRKATQVEWGAALAELAERTGLSRVVDDERDESEAAEMDRAAWERLQKALAAGDRLARWLGEEPPRLTLDEALKLTLDILSWETMPRDGDESGCVRVLSAPSVRAIRVPYLFFAGLSEKAVPPADREDRLYGEGDYARFIELGLPMPDREDRGRGEMLLFYEVITRPTERLFLSYPALDAKAQPLSPSSYLLEVERACGEGKILRADDPDLSPVPREPETPLGPADLRVRAVDALLQGDAKLLAGLLQDEPGLGENLLAGLNVVHERQRGESFGPYEGILPSEAARKKLAERFGPEHQWSPSRLEQYAHCPYQFFLSRVLRLEPLAELSLTTDYARRGHLLHAALSAVHRQLNRRDGRAASPASEEEEAFLKLFGETLEGLIADAPSANDLEWALREIDRRLLSQWGRLYYQQHQKYDECWNGLDQPLMPTHFEVRFGLSKNAHQDDEDALSTDETFAYDLGNGESIRLTGRIDRIDVGQVAGRPVFNVLDYKSGKSSSLKREDIEAGTALQLPLYALAAEKLLLADRGAAPWRTAYWFVKENGYGEKRALAMYELDDGKLVPSGQWEALQETVRARVRDLVHGVRRAEFPVLSADEQCAGRCEFGTVCRVNQARALDKTWPSNR